MMFHVHQSVTNENFEKCHHCFWWYRCVCLLDLPFQSIDLSCFEGNVDSQWKEWLSNSVSYPSTGRTTRVKCCYILPAINALTDFLFTIEQNSSFNSFFSRILKLFFSFWNFILKYKQIVFRLWHDKQSWHEIISVEISYKQKHSKFGIIRSSEFWWRYESYGQKSSCWLRF